MPDLLAIVDDGPAAKQLMSVAQSQFEIAILDARTLEQARPLPGGNLYFHIDLTDAGTVSKLREMLLAKRPAGRMIFGVPKGVHASMVQAYALGATDLIPLPIGTGQFAERLAAALGAGSTLATHDAQADAAVGSALTEGVSALRNIFAFANGVQQIDFAFLGHASRAAADVIADDGLGRWVASVQRHHRTTFQHCLLVAGVAAAFGHHLGLRQADVELLTTAGMLHDIGKARIPLAILDKPTRLTDAEMAIMRTHAAIGHELLASRGDVAAGLLDVVRHHHEYLDGSGYPDGLAAENISDLVRIMTIADVFGALIERRSYKRPLPKETAYDIVCGMAGKLELPLIHAFRPVAMSVADG